MYGTLYRRVADTASYRFIILSTQCVNGAYARYNQLFCIWSCNRSNNVLNYYMWGYEMMFERKSAATVNVSGGKTEAWYSNHVIQTLFTVD
jgi:hypothetical protein